MSQSDNRIIKTDVIPETQDFYNIKQSEGLDYKEIAIFCAIGFFLGDATYYKNKKCLLAGHEYELSPENYLLKKKKYFNWEYKPRNIPFKQSVEEFAQLYGSICKTELEGKRVILPLSGGLDSRSQAAVLTGNSNVFAYSYKFFNSFDETQYGKKIAQVNNWKFKEYVIQPGYLWDKIEKLASLNQCYTDFSAPRQMGIYDEYDAMGDTFFLGHWGDVLFDDMGVNDDMSFEDQVKVVVKKIVKKGGREFAEALWLEWGLDGNFYDYLYERVTDLLGGIKIDNANSRIRAFKSMYWAPRWTSVSLNVFKSKHSLFLPYYHKDMCEFICGIPEEYLAARKIQVEYIKTKNPDLAKISWQTYAPYNLYNYSRYNSIGNIPRRAINKISREVNTRLLGKKTQTTRNWEIQFTGNGNVELLKERLYFNKNTSIVSDDFVSKYFNRFVNEKDKYSFAHPVNMLLVLNMFQNHLQK